METDRWRRITQLCDAALAMPAGERAEFLRGACAGDATMQCEVESLLAQEIGGFLETRPSEPAIGRMQVDLIGLQIGPYKVLSLLGAGGMGEVYRARDSKLGRDVAIKVLSAQFTTDRERLARFEREARMLATLNHPHIGAIYGFENEGPITALVLELVEGPTLAERISKGPLPPTEALIVARQIAEALEAAHEKGIVHRDLKPANIKVMLDGSVKVLDFGLAKVAAGDAAPDLTQLPTMTIDDTREGLIVGTVSYMSPEQASGKPADRRSDLWAFGVVLFEMLTARPVFAGATISHVLAAVLRAEPDWATLPAETPSLIRRLLRRCLEKDRKRRLESAADARLEIEDVLAPPHGEASGVVRARPSWRRWATAAGVLVVVAVSAAAAVRHRWQPAVHPMHFAIPVRGEVTQLALSSDGRFLALVMPDETTGKNILSVQAIGDEQAVPLSGTEGASYPFWSPDGQYVGFFADGKILKVRAAGGPVQLVVPVTLTARGASWGSKNVIVYSQRAGGPLWRINADGSGASVLTEGLLTADERSHRWPVFLPDGDRFLFWAGNFSEHGARNAIYLSSLSARRKDFLVEARSNPGFAADGYLFFVDEKGRLEMQVFDPDTGRVTGDPRVIAAAVGFQPSTYFGAFSVSTNGTVVTNPTSAVSQSVLTWYDRTGNELGIVGAPAMIYNPSLSPDGQQLAADIADPRASNVDVWKFDLKAGTSGRFTFGTVEEATPVWAPDGSHIAYGSADAGMEVKPTTGLEKARIVAVRPTTNLSMGGGLVSPNSWAPDGKYVVTRIDGTRQEPSYLALLTIGEQKLSRILASKGNEANGQISPDGKWLAYATDELGGWNVYATTFPGAAGKWQVSVGGGTEPRWRGDGREIFYLDMKGVLMAVPVMAGPTFSSGTPRPLFHVRSRAPISNTDVFSYDVLKDGSRFIVNHYVKPSFVPPLNILLNASATAERRD